MSAVGTSCLLDGKVSKFIVRGREVISEQLRDVWVMPWGFGTSGKRWYCMVRAYGLCMVNMCG